MPTQAIATIEMIQNLKDGTIPVQKANQDSNGNTITLYYAHGLNFTVDPQTFILTATLTNAQGGAIATQQVDLPLESVVVSGSYDDTTKEVVLTLQNGSTVKFSVADLVDGLASQSALDNIVNNTTKIAETNFGGFSAGKNSSATTGGGAVGSDASTLSGGAVGSGANSTTGGAVGSGAYTTTGFAGGYMAKASAKGAVQLGEGTNTNANTLQFRAYALVDESGNIPDDRLSGAVLKTDLLNMVYPVGSLYISINDVSPAGIIGGSWTKLDGGYALWITDNSTAGNSISAGLPNITGEIGIRKGSNDTNNTVEDRSVGALEGIPRGSSITWATGISTQNYRDPNDLIKFDASKSNSVYGKSDTVQPPAYTVFAWRRSA